MNKDIQTLIEREAKEEYEEYLHGTSDVKEFLDMDDLLPLSDALKACEIATNTAINKTLSLFKWRKVTEELPEMAIDCKTDHAMDRKSDRVLIKTKYGFGVAVYNYYFEDFIANAMVVEGVTEWMPIPQID